MGEVVITRKFFENFSGDNVRFSAGGFIVGGDYSGQHSLGVRWPYGPVGLITPFNFPLEIPALQLGGALFMGNKPLVHVDHRVSCGSGGGVGKGWHGMARGGKGRLGR